MMKIVIILRHKPSNPLNSFFVAPQIWILLTVVCVQKIHSLSILTYFFLSTEFSENQKQVYLCQRRPTHQCMTLLINFIHVVTVSTF